MRCGMSSWESTGVKDKFLVPLCSIRPRYRLLGVPKVVPRLGSYARHGIFQGVGTWQVKLGDIGWIIGVNARHPIPSRLSESNNLRFGTWWNVVMD